MKNKIYSADLTVNQTVSVKQRSGLAEEMSQRVDQLGCNFLHIKTRYLAEVVTVVYFVLEKAVASSFTTVIAITRLSVQRQVWKSFLTGK